MLPTTITIELKFVRKIGYGHALYQYRYIDSKNSNNNLSGNTTEDDIPSITERLAKATAEYTEELNIEIKLGYLR